MVFSYQKQRSSLASKYIYIYIYLSLHRTTESGRVSRTDPVVRLRPEACLFAGCGGQTQADGLHPAGICGLVSDGRRTGLVLPHGR